MDTKSLLNLESAVVHLLLSHGVKLEPNKMLTRCVVCNGSIEPVYDEDRRRDIFKSHQAPDESSVGGLDVFQCNGCSQGYWWCEKPTSSASRVKCQATSLLELCIRGGVPIDSDLGMFSNIDVEKIRATKDEMNKHNELVEERLDVVQWLQVEDLKNPLPSMTSAYALKGTQKESLPFTNVTYDFVGNLDYILYQTQAMKVTDLLYVPKTFGDLNDLNISNGHLLPSYDWPSDHLAIGCRLSFQPVLKNIEKEKDKSFKSLKSDPIPSESESVSEQRPKETSIISRTTVVSEEKKDDPEQYFKGLNSGPISFPPGPPSAVPWCVFIDESESESVSEQRLEEASLTSRTTIVSEEKKDDPEQSFKGSNSGPISFPPGPPLAVPWCGFIDDSEYNSVSKQRPEEASLTSRTTVVSEETKDDSEYFPVPEPASQDAFITSRNTDISEETEEASLPHGERCGCGCVPNVPSLFEMAELRRQHRLKLKNGGA